MKITKIEAGAGEHISTVAARAVEMIRSGQTQVVKFNFNEIDLMVYSGMSAADVCAIYDRESTARHDAYVASPEYKARQQAAEEADRKKRAAFDQAIATAPTTMTLKDADGWAKSRANNTDPYGNAVMVYAETWARLMEGALATGETVASCAERLSHLADQDGITGFMYGAAVSVLAHVWVHGDELRQWHSRSRA